MEVIKFFLWIGHLHKVLRGVTYPLQRNFLYSPSVALPFSSQESSHRNFAINERFGLVDLGHTGLEGITTVGSGEETQVLSSHSKCDFFPRSHYSVEVSNDCCRTCNPPRPGAQISTRTLRKNSFAVLCEKASINHIPDGSDRFRRDVYYRSELSSQCDSKLLNYWHIS